MVKIFKYRLYILAVTLWISVACRAQIADNAPFELITHNKCDHTVRVKVLSKETSGSYLAEQVIVSGETAQIAIDPNTAGDFIQVTNLNSESEIRIYMNNLLQDRQSSPTVVVTIENAHFSANTPQKVDITWKR